MNKFLKYLLIIFLFPFIQCSRCGENISLGEFELSSESKTDWYHYANKDYLIFRNSYGDTITLDLTFRQDEMMYTSFRQICNSGWADSSEEYFLGEWLLSEYSTSINNINYKVQIVLNVEQIHSIGEKTDLILFDQISFQSIVDDPDDLKPGIGGNVNLVADYRGNNILNDQLPFYPSDFFDAIEINGTIYQNVWYFNREGIPSIYVQEQKGIIAFLGIDNEIWVLQ